MVNIWLILMVIIWLTLMVTIWLMMVNICIWLVVEPPTPLKSMMDFVSWDDDFSQYIER